MNWLNPLPTILQHRYLLGQLIPREVLARYRGSVLEPYRHSIPACKHRT
ncbi:hypothetical protein [Candidatus Accumulibacter cognatus]|uniref:Uncharacterized protein n=1 Tax=Candidatus Accumulibacter cognatus TaxID=2954383 RepID=A0A080MB06_9PROT|nr:hypothetical protein [Candidatus Accumulibacter cognatus]KFB78423.1 MAG: hypothetical protein AW06_000229 [Candidatus Accumulibacter cognatus]MCC2869404.1 hypothetical protein [Candidatus Accumulibacter phosphatis]QLH49201.1 MAG: hypothetical protein HWD57_04935 [Candidatus Accumulibacter cognatus]